MKTTVCRLRENGMAVIICLMTLWGGSSFAAVGDPVSVCFNDWPPYTKMTENGADGVSVAIMKKAAQIVGRELRFVETSWNDCLEKVENGELDVILDAAQRDQYLQGPTSFNSYTDTFWVRNSSDVSQYNDLRGGKIALVEGYKYSDRLFDQFDKLGLEVIRGADDPTNIRDLARGQIDAVIADLASTFVYARDNQLKVHPILPPFSADLLYASFNRQQDQLQREFDRAFADLLKQGYVDEVYLQYIGATFSSFSSPQ